MRARYFNFSLDSPSGAQARELSAEERRAYNARLKAFTVNAENNQEIKP